MMFYSSPVALNREAHRNLKLDTASTDFAYAAGTNSMLLAASEIADAARDYPVVFIGGEGQPYTVAAIMGMRDGENLFVDADGNWESGTYLPAFARRYPFVLAEGGAQGGELTVCFDEASPRMTSESGTPLFDEQGGPSQLLQDAIAFLELFHTQMQQTAQMAQRIAEAGLLVPRTMEMVRGEQRYALNGVHVVDRDKLMALDDATVLELHRSGALYAIHAHLMSLSRGERLAAALTRAWPSRRPRKTRPAKGGCALPLRPPGVGAGRRAS
ncbi:SapC family protein [Massilia sp. Dwa41.01b]|uniref:SapC family protein n=1 Tax=Massilia sp. Dwa41.01b TaxID=2709302 RepID=UPI001E534831|nr:SapC family protein [Massilia sp. Dwa41.01b]